MKRKSTRKPLRLALRDVLKPYGSGENSSRLNLFVDVFIFACIIISCLLVPLEHRYPRYEKLLWRIEIGFAVFFIGEYLLRWYASERPLRYPFTFLAMIDLLAILPTLLLLGSQTLVLRLVRGFRLLRLLRLVRVLRLLRYGLLLHRGWVGLRIWYSALEQTYRIRQLGRLVLWLTIALVIGANVLFVTEHSLGAHSGPFSSYWKSYWHVTIALFSGIEDKEPLSLLGRIEMTLLLITGICVVGMFTGEIVSILVKNAQRAGKLAIKPPRARFERHILILGVNEQLDNVIRQVSAAYSRHRPHIVVVCRGADEIPIGDPRLYRKVFAVVGDPVDIRVLEQANLARASRVIVLSTDVGGHDQPAELDNRALIQTLAVVAQRKSNPVPIVVELQSEESLEFATPLAGLDLLVGRHYGEKLISQAVLNPGVTEAYDELMTFTDLSNEFYLVRAPASFLGKTFQQAQLSVLDNDDEDLVLVGIDRSPEGAPAMRFWLNPSAGEAGLSPNARTIIEGDHLVLIGYERPTFDDTSLEDRWSGKILDRG